MTQTGRSDARLHFDPAHNAQQAPTLACLQAWVEARMWSDGEGTLQRTARMARRDLENMEPLGRRLLRVLPGGRQRAASAAKASCTAWIMPDTHRMHDMMREFGMSLVRSDPLDAFETMLGLALTEKVLDLTWASIPGKRRSQREGNETFWVALRHDVEAEALANLYESPELRTAWPRLVAALRAASDEITTDIVRERADDLAEWIEGMASAALANMTDPSSPDSLKSCIDRFLRDRSINDDG